MPLLRRPAVPANVGAVSPWAVGCLAAGRRWTAPAWTFRRLLRAAWAAGALSRPGLCACPGADSSRAGALLRPALGCASDLQLQLLGRRGRTAPGPAPPAFRQWPAAKPDVRHAPPWRSWCGPGHGPARSLVKGHGQAQARPRSGRSDMARRTVSGGGVLGQPG